MLRLVGTVSLFIFAIDVVEVVLLLLAVGDGVDDGVDRKHNSPETNSMSQLAAVDWSWNLK